jgi:hypothetical protein
MLRADAVEAAPVGTRRTSGSVLLVLLVLAAGAVVPVVGAAGSAVAAPPTCQGQPATIVAGPDEVDVVGTDGPDVIVTVGSGSIQIDAGGGDDLICTRVGEAGYVRGESGDDVVFVGAAVRDHQQDFLVMVVDGEGDDEYHGVPGTELSFWESPAGVVIDAASGTALGTGTDRFFGITDVQGSVYADTPRDAG